MAEYTVTTHEPVTEHIVERFNKMGVRLVLEQDEQNHFRVETTPKVFFIHQDRRMLQAHSYNGWPSASQAFNSFNDDVLNRCMSGTSYIYGQCRLLIEDPEHDDLKVYEIVEREPVDTGLRARRTTHPPVFSF